MQHSTGNAVIMRDCATRVPPAGSKSKWLNILNLGHTAGFSPRNQKTTAQGSRQKIPAPLWDNLFFIQTRAALFRRPGLKHIHITQV